MRSLFKRSLLAGAALATASGGLLTLAPTPAQAAQPTQTCDAGNPCTIAVGGSDTTQDFMGAYLAGVTPPAGVTLHNIWVQPTKKGFPSGQTIPGDARCATYTYGDGNATASTYSFNAGAPLAPFGSGQGRDFLNLQNAASGNLQNQTCIDVARSSSGLRTKADAQTNRDGTGFQYYAFALDAVSWASTSLKAPANLTLDQLNKIYSCNITDWSQVGGSAGPIQRYLPQPGSGTRSFFLSMIGSPSLPAKDSAGTGLAAANCPNEIDTIGANGTGVEENSGLDIFDADKDKAILPYSVGLWSNQFNNRANPTLDKRNDAVLRGVTTGGLSTTGSGATTVVTCNGTCAVPAKWNGTNRAYELDAKNALNPNGVVSEANTTQINTAPAFPGIRYLFNVIDSNQGTYGTVRNLVGFDNQAAGTKSPLCSGSQGGLIKSNNFAPLDTSNPTGTNATFSGLTNLAGSNCRAL